MYTMILRAHNLCYATMLPPASARPFVIPTVEYEEHNGQRFVTESVVKGLIPEVVEQLQDCRTRAKLAYAAATDPAVKRICKARELAFKIVGNSVYGALGSSQSMLPLMQIAETVTAIGRNDIMTVKALAERMFPDGKVVYGDTDSVFVRFTVSDASDVQASVEEAMAKAKVLAAAVNEKMQKPKNIAFEKVSASLI